MNQSSLEKRRESSRAWAAKNWRANPEAVRAYHRDYYQKNKEKEKARVHAYRVKNPEVGRAAVKKWREKVRNDPVRWIQWAIARSKKRAKNKHIEHTVRAEDIFVPITCPVLGYALDYGSKGLLPNTPSLDRFDNNRGYVKGNVFVISHRANSLKRDAEVHELLSIITYMQRKHDEQPTS